MLRKLIAVAAAPGAVANVADSSEIIVKRVVIRFVDDRQIESMCGARDASFRHRGLVWLGEACADAVGLAYNPRRLELLAHELKRILTGERHEHG